MSERDDRIKSMPDEEYLKFMGYPEDSEDDMDYDENYELPADTEYNTVDFISGMLHVDVELESDGEPIDVYLFKKTLENKLKIFNERREKYGSHLENAQRFPMEHDSGLMLKLCRAIRQLESGSLDYDTLIDLSNYVDIIISAHYTDGDLP